MNSVTSQISVERVAAVLTAVAPFVAASLPVFKSLAVPVQVAVVVVIGAAGVTWLVGRSKHTVVQQQLDATK